MNRSNRRQRRRLLGYGVKGGAALAGLSLVSCSSSNNTNTAKTATAGAAPATAGGTAAAASATRAASASAAPQAKRGGTLGIGFHISPATLDTAATPLTDANAGILGKVVEPLFALSPSPDQDLVPVLAVSATPSPDQKEWTFALRHNVKFHDGTDWNAQVLKYNVDRARDPKHPQYDPLFTAGTAQSYNNVESVQIVDDYTVKYVLKAPDNDLPGTLYSPVPNLKFYSQKSLIDGGSAAASQKPVGTGPFKFSEWLKDDRITFLRFDGYWGGAPLLDSLVWRIMTDNQSRLAAMLSGDIDVDLQVLPTDASAIQAKKQLTLIRTASAGTVTAIPNTKTLFKDPRVRQALSLAINRKAMLDGPLAGYGSVAKGPMTPSHPFFDSSLPDLPYDPAQAKALLSAAGVTDLKFTMLCSSEPNLGVDFPSIAQLMQQNWAAIGVTVTLNSVAYAQLLTIGAKGTTDELPMLLTSWSINRPGNVGTQFGSTFFAPQGKNRGYWANAQFDQLAGQAAAVPAEQAKALERQAQQVFLQDMGQIPLVYTQPLIAVSQKVGGVPSPLKRWYEIPWEKLSLQS